MWIAKKSLNFPADDGTARRLKCPILTLMNTTAGKTDFSGYDCEGLRASSNVTRMMKPIEKSGPSAPAETLASVPSIPTSAPKSPEPVS
ncbi:hypothetical protein BASA81_007165 [Batrachochytrium salamandrivorans]|nr:hypothetical protein BASA81_007165 [Batrachochytrium salamandrivorans]